MALRLMQAQLCLLLALFPAASQAAPVEIQTAGQVTATADFRPGRADRPAILLLHGFLQTRDFGIIKSIADTLADEGYTVLSPTLSLGISNRKRSLDCEALHLHDMDGDIGEIQQWVKWLREHGHDDIIGVGHSFGGVQLLAWREKYREAEFPLVGISLVGSAPFSATQKPAASAKAPRQAGGALIHAPLSFCDSYTAPAAKHASYSQWNADRVIAAMKRGAPRIDVILGSEDKFPPPGWETRLQKAGAKTHRIRDANHFMDGTQEFDMLEILLGILRR